MLTKVCHFKANLPNSFASAQITTSTPGQSEWIRLTGQVAAQVTGTATSITVQIERSTMDPSVDGPNPAPVDDPIVGDASQGIMVEGYYEPATAWWRVNVKAVSGGEVHVNVAGRMGAELIGG